MIKTILILLKTGFCLTCTGFLFAVLLAGCGTSTPSGHVGVGYTFYSGYPYYYGPAFSRPRPPSNIGRPRPTPRPAVRPAPRPALRR